VEFRPRTKYTVQVIQHRRFYSQTAKMVHLAALPVNRQRQGESKVLIFNQLATAPRAGGHN